MIIKLLLDRRGREWCPRQVSKSNFGVTLTFDLGLLNWPDPQKRWPYHLIRCPIYRWHRPLVPICSKIGSFPKYRVVHEISNRRTNGRTDRSRTLWLRPVDWWRRNKNNIEETYKRLNVWAGSLHEAGWISSRPSLMPITCLTCFNCVCLSETRHHYHVLQHSSFPSASHFSAKSNYLGTNIVSRCSSSFN